MKAIIQVAFVLVFPVLSPAYHNISGIQSGKTHTGSKYPKSFQGPHATFSKQWIDYDVLEDGIKGMRIHLKFTAYEMKNMDSYVAVYFQDASGKRLKDRDHKYVGTSGNVALLKSLNPCCDVTEYSDLQLFMPYAELDLGAGRFDLTMDVNVVDKEKQLIQHLNSYDFAFTNPDTAPANTRTPSNVSASFDSMWVDYDVSDAGEKGMQVHVKFGLTNMKDVDSYLTVSFMRKSGDKLVATDSKYRSDQGEATVYKKLTPGYDDVVYKDAEIFMPYSQLGLRAGNYELTMDVDVMDKEKRLIQHLNYYDFAYEKK